MTAHWRPTCCLRYAASLAAVQLGLGNPAEKSFGSSELRLRRQRARKPSSVRAQTSVGTSPPRSLTRAGPEVISSASAKKKKKTSRGLLAPSALRNLHRSGCKTHGWLRFCTPVGSDSSLLCNCGGGMACQMQSTREQWKCHSLSFRFPLEAVDRFQNTF